MLSLPQGLQQPVGALAAVVRGVDVGDAVGAIESPLAIQLAVEQIDLPTGQCVEGVVVPGSGECEVDASPSDWRSSIAMTACLTRRPKK